MTIDERIEKLTAGQEKTGKQMSNTQTLLAAVVDSIQRLERIALAPSINDDDFERPQ
jgi:hypothetical protein